MMDNEQHVPVGGRVAAIWAAFKAFMTYREVEPPKCYEDDPTPRWFLPY